MLFIFLSHKGEIKIKSARLLRKCKMQHVGLDAMLHKLKTFC